MSGDDWWALLMMALFAVGLFLIVWWIVDLLAQPAFPP